MAKGHKTGGRKKGTPNAATKDVREALALFAQKNIHKLEAWMTAVAKENPARAADILLRALEYHVPRLARSELTGKDGAPLNERQRALDGEFGEARQSYELAQQLAFLLAKGQSALAQLEQKPPAESAH